MKQFIAAAAVLLVISCTSSEKKADLSMTGAYKMTVMGWKSSTTDTTITTPHQMKIFTDDFMMYSNINAPDSVSSFGVGSYIAKNDSVFESIVFSASDSTYDDTLRNYTLVITKTEKGYKQVINGIGSNNLILTEEYVTSGTGLKSSIDGMWKLEKVYWTNGKDTSVNNRIQYKAFLGGNCMWGNVWTDSLNKNHTAMGYGTFTLDGNKLIESMEASTFAAVRGQKFEMDIEFPDADSYQQTRIENDGSKTVEIYRRMKK